MESALLGQPWRSRLFLLLLFLPRVRPVLRVLVAAKVPKVLVVSPVPPAPLALPVLL